MFETREQVGASRTDGTGKLKLASAIDIMQDCSMLWMQSEPVFTGYLEENGLGMLLAFRQVEVLRRPAYGEKLAVRTGIFGCRGFLGYRNTAVYDEGGRPCFLSWSIGTFVHLASGRLSRLPREVIASVLMEDKLDMEYRDKHIPLPEEPGEKRPPVPVRRNDIDLYGHMNNARYLEAALELLPAEEEYTRLRLEYKRPAKFGDLLYPDIRRGPEGERVVALGTAGGESYCIIELT